MGRFWKDFRSFLELVWDDMLKVLDVYQCSDSLCLSHCFFVLGKWWEISIWFGGGLVRCSSWFFTCLSMFWHLILKRLLSCVETRWEFRFGLLWWSGFLTCVLVCSVLFGFPGMVSYGLDHLYWLIVLGLVCLVVSVCAGLAGSVLSWFGRPDIPWSGLISFAPFCFAQVLSVRFGLHWSGQWCSAPGRLVLVKLGH